MAEAFGAESVGAEQAILGGGVGALAAAASLETGVAAAPAVASISEVAPTAEQAGAGTPSGSVLRIAGMRYEGPGTIMHIRPRR